MMNNIYLIRLGSFFHVICWTTTIILVSYWVYEYTLNNDLCIVDYKKYYETESDEFPVLSICLKNHISEEKLRLQNPDIDIESYIKFLGGNEFKKEFTEIDYENVTIDMSKYIRESRVYWRNGTREKSTQRRVLRISHAFYQQRRGELYQCYELETPKMKEMKIMVFDINNAGLPPRNVSQNYEMKTYLHYPNHLITSEQNVKYTWPIRDSNDGYLSRYIIKSVETIRRRNKRRRPCMEWDNYDDSILTNHIKNVGCRAPYQKPVDGYEVCSTKDSMKNASLLHIKNDHVLHPPCKSMSKILYDFEESDMTRTEFYGQDHLEIGIYFFDDSFREIVQTRYCVYIMFASMRYIFHTTKLLVTL